MAEQFNMPDFMKNKSPQEIHSEMLKRLPKDIDTMPGGFPHDFTMPTAIVASELIQYYGMRLVMMMFPQYAWGEWLDKHGQQVGEPRKQAGHSVGKIEIKGEEGTVIKKGTICCTPAYEDGISYEFQTQNEVDIVIGEDEVVSIPIQSVKGGAEYNVAANTITLVTQSVKGMTGITNPEKTKNGCDIESDEEYYKRIEREYHSEGRGYIGNDSDYIRWATSVDEVKDCIVVPAENGNGIVKLIIVAKDGKTSDEVIKKVEKHILSPDDRSKRLLPTGCAKLEILKPDWVPISYKISGLIFEKPIEDEIEFTVHFKNILVDYYVTAKKREKISYNQIRSMILAVDGVVDFEDFLMGVLEPDEELTDEHRENIVLNKTEFPETALITALSLKKEEN